MKQFCLLQNNKQNIKKITSNDISLMSLRSSFESDSVCKSMFTSHIPECCDDIFSCLVLSRRDWPLLNSKVGVICIFCLAKRFAEIAEPS